MSTCRGGWGLEIYRLVCSQALLGEAGYPSVPIRLLKSIHSSSLSLTWSRSFSTCSSRTCSSCFCLSISDQENMIHGKSLRMHVETEETDASIWVGEGVGTREKITGGAAGRGERPCEGHCHHRSPIHFQCHSRSRTPPYLPPFTPESTVGCC